MFTMRAGNRKVFSMGITGDVATGRIDALEVQFDHLDAMLRQAGNAHDF